MQGPHCSGGSGEAGAEGMGKKGVFQAEQRLRDMPKGKHTFQELKGLFYSQSLASKEKVMQIEAEK